jgi:pyruvate dehydrogenase E2 component (dihydrolipoamide acetyltransferase)
MPINILMPALSPTMEEGTLAKWLVKEGDTISSGDVIAEIETDKATMEVEAVDEGKVGKILVSEGTQGVKVNETIAVLLEEGEDASAIGSGAARAETPSPSTDTSKEPTPVVRDAPGPGPAEGYGRADVKSPPESTPKGNGAAGAPASSGETSARGAGERVFASPLARRLAREAGIEISAIRGSGPHGRIIRRDVEEAKEKGVAAPQPQAAKPQPSAPQAPAPAAAPRGMSDEQIRKFFDEGSFEVVPHDNMRKVIARRLTEAKSTIPHFYLTVDVTLDPLLKLRGQINAAAPVKDNKPAFKVSVNDMVIKALALALQRVPEANVTWTEGGMLKHRHSDVGVAVAIPGGLITPVIRKAEQKTLSTISTEMKDFAKRARERKLQPQEYQGGSTAVSNLGMFGIKDFSAVINPPHATILAVGAGEQRAVVKDGAVGVATIMSCTLSTDHRAVDGALGAELMAAFRDLIENPMGMLV